MTDKDKEKEKLKTYFILYGMLWFLGLVIAGALGYNRFQSFLWQQEGDF